MNKSKIFNKRNIHTKRKLAGGNKSSSGSPRSPRKSISSSESFDPSTHCSVCYNLFDDNNPDVINKCCPKSVVRACKKCNESIKNKSNKCLICRKPFSNLGLRTLRRSRSPRRAQTARASSPRRAQTSRASSPRRAQTSTLMYYSPPPRNSPGLSRSSARSSTRSSTRSSARRSPNTESRLSLQNRRANNRVDAARRQYSGTRTSTGVPNSSVDAIIDTIRQLRRGRTTRIQGSRR